MTRPTPLWRSLAVLGAASLALTACGGTEPAETTAPPPSPGAETAPPADTPEPTTEPTESAPPEQNTGDGTLTIGTLLPQTGSLAFLGPPEFAGVDLAVQEINKAGGVLGKDIEKFDSDSGDTSTDIASQSVDRLLSQGADVIIGAASSSVSFTVIDKITGAGVVHFSPANTSPDFTTYDDKGLYFRTAPSDVLQGRTLGDLIISEGNASVGILALQDAYGEGLANNAEKSINSQGGDTVAKVFYDPKAAEFSAEVSKIKQQDPDAVVLIGFDESAKVINELVAQGIGPQEKPLYLVDGNIGNALGEKLKKGLLEGVRGTLPGAEASQEFRDRLLKVDPKLKDFSYAAESYDAVILSALAAQAADSDAGADIAKELVNVSKGGTECTSFEECKKMLEDGDDIDYSGVSGPIEFSDAGDPQVASIGIYTYGPDNKLLAEAEYRQGQL